MVIQYETRACICCGIMQNELTNRKSRPQLKIHQTMCISDVNKDSTVKVKAKAKHLQIQIVIKAKDQGQSLNRRGRYDNQKHAKHIYRLSVT